MNNNTQYLRLKKKNNALTTQVSLLRMLVCLLFGVVLVCGVVIFVLAGKVVVDATSISELQAQVESLTEQKTELEATVKKAAEDLQKTSTICVTLQNQAISLGTTIKEQNEELAVFREREELYDKYEYAITRVEDGSRTDISYDNIKTIESIAEEEGMGSDTVTLVLALSMTESNGTATAKNSKSTATGLNQLLYGTAKYTYEDIMGNGKGTYMSSLALDPETNLTMAIYYVNWLSDNHDSNYGVLKEYTGYETNAELTAYISKLNKYLGEVNLSFAKLDLED